MDKFLNQLKILLNDKNKSIPRIDFFQNNNDDLVFFFRIPLLSVKIEDINIILKKTGRDIKMQFDKLAERYEKMKTIIFGLDNPTNHDSNNKVSKLQKLVDPSGNFYLMFMLGKACSGY